MIYKLLKNAIIRHLEETRVLFNQITDHSVLSEPVQLSRPLGEIILHIIRSIEYYLRGAVTDDWGEPLPYNMNTHSSAQEIIRLYGNVSLKATKYLDQISSTDVNDVLVGLERPATRAEILMEMLEHSIHHRGQLIVYFRLLDIEPVKISYIV